MLERSTVHPGMPLGNGERPKVTVALLARNHEHHIVQSMLSVLSQRVDFPYDVVVGDDASSDRTRELVAGFQDAHPGRVRLLTHREPRGLNAVLVSTLAACRGEYVALLEGDDFWTSPFKLQRQSDFLDDNPHCAMCYHPVRVLRENGRGRAAGSVSPVRRRTASIRDIISDNFIHLCSVMCRNGTIEKFPDGFADLETFDWPLHILIARRGGAHGLPEAMAVDRVRNGRGSSARDEIERLTRSLRMLEAMNRHLDLCYDAEFRRSIAGLHCRLAGAYARSGNAHAARNAVRECVAAWRKRHLPATAVAAAWFAACCPVFSRVVCSRRT